MSTIIHLLIALLSTVGNAAAEPPTLFAVGDTVMVPIYISDGEQGFVGHAGDAFPTNRYVDSVAVNLGAGTPAYLELTLGGGAFAYWRDRNPIASVKVGSGGTWVDIDTSTTTCTGKYARDGMCVGEVSTVVRFRMDDANLISNLTASATNWLYFRYNGHDVDPNAFDTEWNEGQSGYWIVSPDTAQYINSIGQTVTRAFPPIRVLESDGLTNLVTTTFLRKDPSTYVTNHFDWRSGLTGLPTHADSISLGQTTSEARRTLTLFRNGPTAVAACVDCHADGMADLFYFRVDPQAIIERSLWHNLTLAEGRAIAAYVHSKDFKEMDGTSRPLCSKAEIYNPTFQPGIGLDSDAACWSAGAGYEAVLDVSVETTRYPVWDQIGSRYDFMNMRETPVEFMAPSWKDWLPNLDYLSGWGEGTWESSTLWTRYQELLTEFNGQNRAAEMLGKLSQVGNRIRKDVKQHDTLPSIGPGKHGPNYTISGFNWGHVRGWTYFNYYHNARKLESAGNLDPEIPNCVGDSIGWVADERWLFDNGPHITKDQGYTQAEQPMFFNRLTDNWYHMNLVINSSQCTGAQMRPNDQKYSLQFISTENPYRYTYTYHKFGQMQRRDFANATASNIAGYFDFRHRLMDHRAGMGFQWDPDNSSGPYSQLTRPQRLKQLEFNHRVYIRGLRRVAGIFPRCTDPGNENNCIEPEGYDLGSPSRSQTYGQRFPLRVMYSVLHRIGLEVEQFPGNYPKSLADSIAALGDSLHASTAFSDKVAEFTWASPVGNQSPVFDKTPATATITIGATVVDSVVVSDPDGDNVTISVDNPPLGFSIAGADPQRKELTFTPVQTGNFSIAIRATDTNGASSSYAWPVTVQSVGGMVRRQLFLSDFSDKLLSEEPGSWGVVDASIEEVRAKGGQSVLEREDDGFCSYRDIGADEAMLVVADTLECPDVQCRQLLELRTSIADTARRVTGMLAPDGRFRVVQRATPETKPVALSAGPTYISGFKYDRVPALYQTGEYHRTVTKQFSMYVERDTGLNRIYVGYALHPDSTVTVVDSVTVADVTEYDQLSMCQWPGGQGEAMRVVVPNIEVGPADGFPR